MHLLLGAVAQHKLSIRYILLTHAHLDHISGVGRAKEALGALSESIGMMISIAASFSRARIPASRRSATAGRFLHDGPGPWRFGTTPSACLIRRATVTWGVCLAVQQEQGPVTLFVGDALFAGGIGRTDLPGGNMMTLLTSIRDVLLGFPDETVVHSGHGPSTTIGREKQTNPYLLQL